MEEFEAERKKLIRRHGDEKATLMKIYWEELLVLEKEFEDELTLLIDKYTPNQTVKFWADERRSRI